MFITLEGGEGAGKSTQARRLAAWLAGQGHPVLLTREPGGAPGAETLRGLLLSGRHDWSAQAEMLLHFAARAEHVARTIRPALAAGMVVVCDRFCDSTMAYQGYGQGADRGQIATLIGLLGIVPDLTFVLDVKEDVAAARMVARGLAPDRYDRLGAGFHARVAAGFRSIARSEPSRCRTVDASGSVDAVFDGLTASFSLARPSLGREVRVAGHAVTEAAPADTGACGTPPHGALSGGEGEVLRHPPAGSR